MELETRLLHKIDDPILSRTERARASDLLVQRTSIYRQYRVTNRATGAQYVVNFFVTEGKRYGHCDCQAGARHIACKHLAAATGLHVTVASERAQGQIDCRQMAA